MNGNIWKWIAVVLTGVVISLIALIYGQLKTGNVEAMEGAKMVAEQLTKYQNERVDKDLQTALILQSIDLRISRIEDYFNIPKKVVK